MKTEPSFREPRAEPGAPHETRWDNLRVAALCIGVQAYKGGDVLGNAVRDCEAVARRINALPRCRAATLVNPKTNNEIYCALRDQFLEPLRRKPPEVVVIFYAGHGKQIDNELFLLPTGAKWADAHDCRQTCTSHLQIFTWLKEILDEPAMRLRYSSERPPVRFVLAFDMCRDGVGASSSFSQPFDPEQQSAPLYWSMCLSTSRGAVAQDGDESASHSPFASELLDSERGIFAAGVSLKQGIENACARTFEKTQQQPVCMALDRLPPSFCMDDSPVESKLEGGGRGD